MITKKCAKCKRVQLITEFYIDNHRNGGYTIWCKKCNRIASKFNSRIYRKKHAQRCKESQKLYRSNNKEKVSARGKAYYQNIRKQVFDFYGRICVCCGETKEEFMSIDHIFNDGSTHRKKYGRSNIYLWLIQSKFPKDRFQVLCHNCNMAKGLYGKCPHKI